MSQPTEIRDLVRERYAAAATRSAERQTDGCCGAPPASSGCGTAAADERFGATLYAGETTDGATDSALSASLGCGVPTAVADLHEGETVLDLGSGAGADVLISARRVGPTGQAIGLDMTDEMLELARAQRRRSRRRRTSSSSRATSRRSRCPTPPSTSSSPTAS